MSKIKLLNIRDEKVKEQLDKLDDILSGSISEALDNTDVDMINDIRNARDNISIDFVDTIDIGILEWIEGIVEIGSSECIEEGLMVINTLKQMMKENEDG